MSCDGDRGETKRRRTFNCRPTTSAAGFWEKLGIGAPLLLTPRTLTTWESSATPWTTSERAQGTIGRRHAVQPTSTAASPSGIAQRRALQTVRPPSTPPQASSHVHRFSTPGPSVQRAAVARDGSFPGAPLAAAKRTPGECKKNTMAPIRAIVMSYRDLGGGTRLALAASRRFQVCFNHLG
jgi:hypothetical protein